MFRAQCDVTTRIQHAATNSFHGCLECAWYRSTYGLLLIIKTSQPTWCIIMIIFLHDHVCCHVYEGVSWGAWPNNVWNDGVMAVWWWIMWCASGPLPPPLVPPPLPLILPLISLLLGIIWLYMHIISSPPPWYWCHVSKWYVVRCPLLIKYYRCNHLAMV